MRENQPSRLVFFADVASENSGQAIVSRFVLEESRALGHRVDLVPLGGRSLLGATNMLWGALSLIVGYFRHGGEWIVYFTPSRGRISMCRDVLIFWWVKLFRVFVSRNVRVVAHLHGADFDTGLKRFPCGIALAALYRGADAELILLAARHQEFARAIDGCRTWILPNFFGGKSSNDFGADSLAREHEFRAFKDGAPDVGLQFAHLSSPIAEKGLDTAVSLLAEMARAGTPWVLNAIGWTKNDFDRVYPEMTELSDRLEEEGRVVFHGHCDPGSRDQILRRTHVLLFLSRYESEAQPLSVIEAVSAGCVVVVSNHNFLNHFCDIVSGVFNFDFINAHSSLRIPTLLDGLVADYFSKPQVQMRSEIAQQAFSKERFAEGVREVLHEG